MRMLISEIPWGVFDKADIVRANEPVAPPRHPGLPTKNVGATVTGKLSNDAFVISFKSGYAVQGYVSLANPITTADDPKRAAQGVEQAVRYLNAWNSVMSFMRDYEDPAQAEYRQSREEGG